MLKVVLSHDVDRIRKHYQYLTYTAKYLLKADLKKSLYHFSSFFKEEPYWNFPEIMKIEDSYGVRSTFFVLDETLPFKPFDKKNWQLSLGRYKISNPKLQNAVKELDKNGWEIGVHGSYLAYKDENLLRQEKQNIENIIGHEIIGIRQHYLNWNENTWEIHKKCGFKYDSTWGLTKGMGIKENKITPYRPFNDYFIEIPLMVMDTPFLEIPENKRWEELNKLLDLLEEKDGIFVINWHQRVYKEVEFPQYRSSYERIIQLCQQRNAQFSTMGELYKQLDKNLK